MKKHRIQNTEQIEHRKHRQTKNLFSRRIGRKCRLVYIRIEQSDDQTQIMRKKLFRSSFKRELCLAIVFYLSR